MHKLENSISPIAQRPSNCESNHNIIYQVVGQVAYIRLNRPEKMNSLYREMINTIINSITQAEQNPFIKVIVLQGSGNSFCAGQDLSELIDNQNLSVKELLDHYHDKLILAIRKCNKPIIAAVNGVAAGAGAIIAIACDLTIAEENSQFIFGFAKIGLTSGSGGTHFLKQAIGMQKTAALLMLSEKLTAQEAENLGLIYKVEPKDTFEFFLHTLVEKICTSSSLSISLTKQLINNESLSQLENQITIENKSKCLAANGEDYKEGVKAFIEKRKPNFNQSYSFQLPFSLN